jgi:hypothetical protein
VVASLPGSVVATSAVRRSKRLASKKKQLGGGLETTSAVQELLARACGIIAKDGAFDDAAKAAYLKLFSSEIAAPVIQAIDSLIKQVKKVQKNGRAKEKSRGKSLPLWLRHRWTLQAFSCLEYSLYLRCLLFSFLQVFLP